MSSTSTTGITRADLAKLSIAQPEDKDKTAEMMAQSLKRDILSYNSKGVTHAIMSIYDERHEIQNKVLEKMKEIFVDSKIEIQTTCAGYKNLAVNWALTVAEKAEAEAEADSDSESDSDSDSESVPSKPINLHIVLSEGESTYKVETFFMIMVVTIVMSVAGSWIMVISYNM
jgi:hypothetical protein